MSSMRPIQAFEPSTWAEVEDAAASRKASGSRVSHKDVPAIIAFTEYPARCLDGSIPDIPPQPQLQPQSAPHGQQIHSPNQYPEQHVRQRQEREPYSNRQQTECRQTAQSQPCRQSHPQQDEKKGHVNEERTPRTIFDRLPAVSDPAQVQKHPDSPQSAPLHVFHASKASSDVRRIHAHQLPPVASLRPRRNPQHIEDLLGLGRVDLETQALVRRYSTDSANTRPAPTLPPWDQYQLSFVSPAVHPASPSFNAALYLARIHRDTPLLDLAVSRRRVLSSVSDMLTADAEKLRASSHARICLAASAVDAIRRSAHNSSSFADLLANMSESNQFEAAVNLLDEKYRHILDRQEQIDRFKHVLGVIKRFSWLLQLPSALMSSENADFSEIEQTARQLLRASAWIKAQDGQSGPSRRWIERELRDGLSVFVDTLEDRLSRPGSSDLPNFSGMIAVLENVDHERVVHSALVNRVNAAKESLRKSARIVPISAVVRARVGDSGGHGDALELVTRLSRAFVDGLTNVWNLARILASRPKYNDAVDMLVPSLIKEFTENIRVILLNESHVVTRDALREIDHARFKALKEVRVPSVYLEPLNLIVAEVADVHVSSLVRVVKTCSANLAQSCFESNSVGARLPQLAMALAEETLSEVSDFDLMSIESLAVSSVVKRKDIDKESNAFLVAKTCIRIPEMIVQRLRELISDKTIGGTSNGESVTTSSQRSNELPLHGNESALPTFQSSLPDFYGNCVLGTARCCCEFVDNGIVEAIGSSVKEKFNDQILDVLQASVLARIRCALHESIKLYCMRLSPEVRRSARRITELRSAEGLRTSQSMDIVSASAQAVEVLLNISLAVCRARQYGAGSAEILLVQKELTEQVARVVSEAMRGSGGTADMAAQIWVDVSFLMTCLGDLRVPSSEVAKAADRFVPAKDLAAEAVRRAGFSFGSAEEENLRRTAVEPSVQRARLIRQAMDIRVADAIGPLLVRGR